MSKRYAYVIGRFDDNFHDFLPEQTRVLLILDNIQWNLSRNHLHRDTFAWNIDVVDLCTNGDL